MGIAEEILKEKLKELFRHIVSTKDFSKKFIYERTIEGKRKKLEKYGFKEK